MFTTRIIKESTNKIILTNDLAYINLKDFSIYVDTALDLHVILNEQLKVDFEGLKYEVNFKEFIAGYKAKRIHINELERFNLIVAFKNNSVINFMFIDTIKKTIIKNIDKNKLIIEELEDNKEFINDFYESSVDFFVIYKLD